MRVVLSVPGRFHLFNLAQQLLRRDYLLQLITSYPKFEVQKYGIPPNKVSSLLIKEVLERSWRHLPAFVQRLYNPQYAIYQSFDQLAKSRLNLSADLVVGSSSAFLETLRQARRAGAVTIVDRGSSHIVHQANLLRDEYALWHLTPGALQVPHQRVIEKELLEYEEADFIAIPSRFVLQSFVDRGVSEEKLVHIPYGVDLTEFKQAPKRDGVFRVVYAGHMSLRKGLPYLLQAFSELALPNSELLLVGAATPEIDPFFRRYAGAFTWLDHVPQPRLHDYYSQGSVFVMASIEEGLAVVQAQAMACGLPVICTSNTGGADIVRDGVDGFVIPIRDVEAIKERLLYLYDHAEEREAMGQSAKDHVARRFTWDGYGERMVAFYEKALAAT